jgi:hypothetical protein
MFGVTPRTLPRTVPSGLILYGPARLPVLSS